ncbi:MAG: iron ABC transporter substrate-binding protein, partial [Desulfobacterales bacterium]
MTTYFQITDTLYSITEHYPETVAVFASNGFPQMKDGAMRAQFGKMISLDAALKMKNLNQDSFISLLDTAIEAEGTSSDATLARAAARDKDGLNVVGLLPCPVRLPL